MRIEAGRDKHKLGIGINSLLWNGEGSPYWFAGAKLHTKHIRYQVRFNRINSQFTSNMAANSGTKWVAQHTLSYVSNRWQLSLYEAVIWGAQDVQVNRGFDWHYLSPALIYRPAEFNAGSADNVILGLDARIHLHEKLSVYTQLVVDEFLLDEIRKNDGWWANKFGGLIGASFQGKKHCVVAELLAVRPFTYSHGNTTIAYVNQETPFGAFRGAGLAEANLFWQYRFSSHWQFGVQGSGGSYYQSASDGGNPFISYNERIANRGYQLLAPDNIIRAQASGAVSYLLFSKLNTWLTLWGGSSYNQQTAKAEPWFQIKISNTLFSIFP